MSENSKPTVMCVECTREFEIEPGTPGRRPSRCPSCRKEHQAREQEPKTGRGRARPALDRSTRPSTAARRGERGASPQAEAYPVGLTADAPSYVTEFAQRLRTEIAELERTLASRRELLAAVEAYV